MPASGHHVATLASAGAALALSLAAIGGALLSLRRRHAAAGGHRGLSRPAQVVLLAPERKTQQRPEQRPPAPKPRSTVASQQVFDVQWNLIKKKTELVCESFRKPAGNGLDGRFTRPDVDSTDCYELVESEVAEGEWALRQLDEQGHLKHQLTTYGKVKVVGADFMLYIGDGEYGTLFLSEERARGDRDTFAVFFADPPKETVANMWEGVISTRPSASAAPGGGAAAACSRPPGGAAPGSAAAAGQCVALVAGAGAAASSFSSSPRGTTSPAPGHHSTTMLRGLSDDGQRVYNLGAHGVRFYHEVGTKMISNLTELDPQEKAKLWWAETDFEEFVKVRKDIEKAYGRAARELGVDLEGVRSEGAKGKEAYEAMVARHPEYVEESRRGLGMGRKKKRARNRDAYIAAVLQEQERQVALEQEALAGGVARPASIKEDAIRQAAMRASEKDREHARILARTYYEQDRTYFLDSDEGVRQSRLCPENLPDDTPGPGVGRKGSASSLDSTASSLHLDSIRREVSIEEFQELAEGAAAHARLNCKGFGLSRQKLELFGLSAMGFTISRRPQLGAPPECSDDSATSAGESDPEF